MTLIAWHPGMMRPDGPCAQHFRQRDRAGVGVVIADLTILRDEDPRELVVEVHVGRMRGEARRSIVDWADALGYRRIWLPGQLVVSEPDPEIVGGLAGTRCPSCRSRWENEAFDFWEMVREWGFFPLACPLCAADLPQWTVAR